MSNRMKTKVVQSFFAQDSNMLPFSKFKILYRKRTISKINQVVYLDVLNYSEIDFIFINNLTTDNKITIVVFQEDYIYMMMKYPQFHKLFRDYFNGFIIPMEPNIYSQNIRDNWSDLEPLVGNKKNKLFTKINDYTRNEIMQMNVKNFLKNHKVKDNKQSIQTMKEDLFENIQDYKDLVQYNPL
jgi:hypothetical protein